MNAENATAPDEKKSSMNLFQKLVEIRKEITYAQKKAEGYGFQYATESQILGAIRPKMDELGVLFHVNMKTLEVIPCSITVKGAERKVEKIKATFDFTWIDAETGATLSSQYILPGDEFDTKAGGAILTYAIRYFLYKSLSVPTDKDDPDAFENSVAREKARGEEAADLPKVLSEEQVKAIESLTTKDRIKNICATYNVKSLRELDVRFFQFIMNSLSKNKKEEVVA